MLKSTEKIVFLLIVIRSSVYLILCWIWNSISIIKWTSRLFLVLHWISVKHYLYTIRKLSHWPLHYVFSASGSVLNTFLHDPNPPEGCIHAICTCYTYSYICIVSFSIFSNPKSIPMILKWLQMIPCAWQVTKWCKKQILSS